MWGLKAPDANIDHRRVPNLQCYFKRKGYALSVSKNAADFKSGDIVTVMVGGRLPHIMIVSDRKSAAGVPLALHNIGSGTQEEDVLFAYPMTERRNLRLKPALQAQTKTAIIPTTSKKASSAQDCATGVALATGWRVSGRNHPCSKIHGEIFVKATLSERVKEARN